MRAILIPYLKSTAILALLLVNLGSAAEVDLNKAQKIRDHLVSQEFEVLKANPRAAEEQKAAIRKSFSEKGEEIVRRSYMEELSKSDQRAAQRQEARLKQALQAKARRSQNLAQGGPSQESAKPAQSQPFLPGSGEKKVVVSPHEMPKNLQFSGKKKSQ